MPALDPQQQRVADMHRLARVGGLTTMIRHGPDRVAARAREGLWAKFCREADPDGTLSDVEREKRAQLVQRAYYARLAQRSSAARRKRSATTSGLPGVEA
jgi:hypothetical protein